MKKFLASVLSVLMLVSCMSFVVNAQDAEQVTITFNAYNGDLDISASKITANRQVTTADVAVGAAIPFPADPTYVRHTFKGWSLTENGEVVDTATQVAAAGGATYYAVWEQTTISEDPIFVQNVSDNKNNHMHGEGCGINEILYDAIADVVYRRYYGSKDADFYAYLNMYGLGKDSLYTSQNNLYFTSYYRSNFQGGQPYVSFYNTSSKKGVLKGYGSAKLADKAAGDEVWTDQLITMSGTADLGRCTHIAYRVVGDAPMKKNDGKWFDVAGAYVFESTAAAEAFEPDFSLKGAEVYFDACITEDDDTDVYAEYPANLENDGNALVGWTLDPTADEVVFTDLTAIAKPEADVTYYAVWSEERTFNFYKNDGTDAVETLVFGKGAALTAPEFKVDGKLFLGWAETADGEIVELPATAEENKDYYAIWKSTWLTSVTVNGNDHNSIDKKGKWYGIENLEKADRLDFVMPYGFPTDVIPTVAATANAGEAVYTAPATFDGVGSIVVGDVTFPVTFTVADRDSVENLAGVPTSAVDIGDGKRGSYAIKDNTDKGIPATKYIPIYSEESEYYVADKYIPTAGTSPELWGVLPGHNGESYDQYRMLIYYDTGADGAPDVDDAVVQFGYSGYHTRGTLSSQYITAANGYKYDRWEYIYFNIPDDKYGYTMQNAVSPIGKDGNLLHDDTYYIAEIAALVDADEKFLQYTPVGLSSTNETSAKNDGKITGVASDMEISVDGGEFVAVTTFEGYNAETGVIAGLSPATYALRYAGNDQYAASEAVELTITPDSVEIYFEDGDNSTAPVEKIFAYQEAVTPAEAPSKVGFTFAGWALGDATEAYDFTDVTATADLDGVTFNALWEKVTEFYVNGSATTNGNGLTAETPFVNIADAWNAIGEYDGTIYITGVTKLQGTIEGKGGNITITSADENAYITVNGPSFKRGNGGSIKFENIEMRLAAEWSFLNFAGLNYEFGEGVKVPVGEVDGTKYYTLKVRSGGEEYHNITVDGAKVIPVAEKVVIRSGAFGTVFLGGKGAAQIEDIYAEYYGGTGGIAVGNDSSGSNKGVLGNARILLEATAGGVSVGNNSTGMTGAFEFIANNGATTVPTFSVEPQGGKWLVHSAEGGRVDFTETTGTFAVTTDKTYAVITDAEGNATKIRMADGVSGDAELYAETKTLSVQLAAGTYNVTYTDEGVSVKGKFMEPSMEQHFELNADNDYTAQASEDVINRLKDAAVAGYKFSGEFASRDGKYTTVNGAITVTEYTDEYIELFPVFVEDDSVAYYHATGVYNDVAGTYDVTVSIANGKFVAGTVGLTNLNAEALELTGVTMSDDAANNLGSAPAIVSEAPDGTTVVVWNAAEGSIDATNGDVALMTFNFKVLDATAFETGKPVVEFYTPQTSYEDYYEDGYYQASPVNAEGEDEFAVNFVDVYLGKIEFEKAATDPATITVKVTMPDKTGATVDDIAYLAYFKNYSDVKFIALEEAGNTEKTITVTLTDIFYVGETYTFTVVKNGYTGSEMKEITIEDGMVLETTILGGDIKESFTGEDANAVDISDFGDGDVTLADFVRVVRAFDENASEEFKAVVDINEDGAINVTDIGIVKANYGKSFEDVELAVSTNG